MQNTSLPVPPISTVKSSATTRMPFNVAASSQSFAAGATSVPAARKKHVSMWVKLASAFLAAFTVFVLLDTFAIARVQEQVHEADLSSIVGTQHVSTAEEDRANENSASTQTQTEGAGTQVYAESADAQTQAGTTDAQTQAGTTDAQTQEGTTDAQAQTESATTNGVTVSDHGSSFEASAPTATATSASTSADNIQVNLTTLRAYDTDIYIADVQVTSAEYLKTAFAQNAFGRNLKDSTSNMAKDNNAILAINGDYYGFRDDGYVIRNGVLYRDTAASNTDALVISGDGTMSAVSEDETSAQDLLDTGAWQVLSFGPVLIEDGQIAVSEGEEVGQSMRSNPRTAIGMISPLHYIVVVSDGRTDASAGLSLYELAQVMKDAGATFAYNLDGGGSTTMYYNGEVVNNPTSGHSSGEREVSDIVYFG